MALWIVSNRLPYSYNKKLQSFQPSSGGLVSAIQSLRGFGNVHWAGSIDPEAVDQMKEKFPNLAPVSVDPELYRLYYNGFGNDVLWPLVHYEAEYVRYTLEAWEAYQKVNAIFADTLMKQVTDQDAIWVQDFHLFLLPKYLRERSFKGKIGFFLHVPFPSSEVFRQLPVRKEILEGVVHADLIGFHDYNYLRHFSSSVYALLGVQPTLNTIQFDSHASHLGVFPISIDTPVFIKDAKSEKVQKAEEKYSLVNWKRKMILGIDRLDYSKGIELKLLAYRELLKTHPELHGHVQFLQVAVPSRTDVPEYKRLRRTIENLVANINGQFGRLDWIPVNYMFQSIKREDLLALYKNSEVLFVASKRDGMNLVSLEYLASQDPEHPGSVVLSEFAGAASVLSQCYIVNPWNVEDTADALHIALTSSLDERKQRFRPMFEFLKTYTSNRWAESFMKQLQPDLPAKLTPKTETLSLEKAESLIKVSASPHRVILIDYDGTFVPIRDRPELALPSQEDLNFLRKLADQPCVDVVIVSGRPMSFLQKVFAHVPVCLASDHGALFYDYRTRQQSVLINESSEWFEDALKIMEDFARLTPESFIEKKDYSMAWHFRQSPTEFAAYQARRLINELEDALANYPAQVIHGKKVVEVRAMEANKGHFLTWLKSANIFPKQAMYICLGDDVTDEDMFRAIGPRGLAIKVGKGATAAPWRVERQTEIYSVLKTLCN